MIEFSCAYCGNPAKQPKGAVNRARKIGAALYCDRKCAGLGRRKHKTKQQLIAEKATYDRERRRGHADRIRAEKAAYFQRTYDPAKAAIERKKRMPKHIEYCRRPEYREKKSIYDRKRRAAEYGEYSEAYLLFLQLQREIKERTSRYEIAMVNGTINKTQKRKRAYGQVNGS